MLEKTLCWQSCRWLNIWEYNEPFIRTHSHFYERHCRSVFHVPNCCRGRCGSPHSSPPLRVHRHALRYLDHADPPHRASCLCPIRRNLTSCCTILHCPRMDTLIVIVCFGFRLRPHASVHSSTCRLEVRTRYKNGMRYQHFQVNNKF